MYSNSARDGIYDVIPDVPDVLRRFLKLAMTKLPEEFPSIEEIQSPCKALNRAKAIVGKSKFPYKFNSVLIEEGIAYLYNGGILVACMTEESYTKLINLEVI